MVEEEGLEGSFGRGDTGNLSYEMDINLYAYFQQELEIRDRSTLHRHEILEVGVWEL